MFPMKPPIGAQLNRSHRLARGLVGAWLFNEKGGLTAHDLSGKGNNGVLTNMANPGNNWQPQGILFGDDDYINCGSPLDVSGNSGAWSAACLFSSNATADNYLIGTDLYTGWYMRLEVSGALLIKIDDGVNDEYVASAQTGLNDGNPHIVVCTLNSNTGEFLGYIDGGLAITLTTGSVGALTDAFRISGIFGEMKGVMESALYYNRALPANEIAELYLDPYAAFRPSLSIFPALESTSAKTGSADVTDSVSIAEQVAGDDDYDSAFVKFENLPNLTGKTITSAKVYLYGEETELTEGFDFYFDVVGAWSSASNVATLEALSFNNSVSSGVGTILGAWHEYDILGDATKGLQKIYTDAGGDPSALIATLKIKVDPDFFTADITDPNFIGVGNNGDARWAEETDATFYPYIVIEYETAASGGAWMYYQKMRVA